MQTTTDYVTFVKNVFNTKTNCTMLFATTVAKKLFLNTQMLTATDYAMFVTFALNTQTKTTMANAITVNLTTEKNT